MHDLKRIEDTLASKRLDTTLFERFAQDALSSLYPGLSPISGGTDWGRDADIASVDGGVPRRLLVTTSKTLEGVRNNMLGGIASMKAHGVPFDRVVLANPAVLSTIQRSKLGNAARAQGAMLDASDVFDRGYFASRLRRDGYWRSTLLGLSSDPVTLSSAAPELAESPWSQLPLVGRDNEVNDINSARGDLIVSAPPGVGKSRVLQEADNTVFVDTGADLDQVADDLRWILPEVVVVDDAARSELLVKRLVSLRRSEQDLFAYRIIASCWPDEVEVVRTWLPEAELITLGLLERAPMDEIVRAMGITAHVARAEILEQAEGRAGWAIALGDLLVRSGDVESLVQGRALYGQVSRFLQRAGASSELRDVLALISLLGAVTEDELTSLSQQFGPARLTLTQLLNSAGRSGLIDVKTSYSLEKNRNVRSFEVRPPMLRYALVAEHLFRASAPLAGVDQILIDWPTHRAPVTRATIQAALVEAPGARTPASTLFYEMLEDGSLEVDDRVKLATEYALIDGAAGDEVLELARQAVASRAGQRSRQTGFELEPAVQLADLVARRYSNSAGFRVLLDAALLDERETNPHPGHPLRRLADAVTDFHPEIARSQRLRSQLATSAAAWVTEVDDAERWRVYSHVARFVLTFHLDAAFTDPGKPLTVTLIKTVLPPSEMQNVFDEILPTVVALLDERRDDLGDALISTAEDWVRIGKGFDRPFGVRHAAASLKKSKELGVQLYKDLEKAPLSRGARLHLKSSVQWFKLRLSVPVDLGEDEPFFRRAERRKGDYQAAAEKIAKAVRVRSARWADREPAEVATRLAKLKREIEASSLTWPDRIWIACGAIAERASNPTAWIEALRVAGLLAYAQPFVVKVLDTGPVTVETVGELIAERGLRSNVISHVVCLGDAVDQSVLATVLDAVSEDDVGLFTMLAAHDRLSVSQWKNLLSASSSQAGVAIAVGYADGRRLADPPTIPAELRDEWQHAVSAFRYANFQGLADHDAAELFELLATEFPDTLEELVRSSLREADPDVYHALSHSSWDALWKLPHDHKLRLWVDFADSAAAWLLRQHLVGADVDFARKLIETGTIPADELLGFVNGLDARPPLEDLARLLVPRGVDPASIAAIEQSGSWTGDESLRYQRLVDKFREWQNSSEEPLRLVGAEGVRIFEAQRDRAAAREHEERVRGHR